MDINKQRNQKKLTAKISPIFEPFAIIVLLAVFAIPILAVINLSPETRPTNTNVLGAKTVPQTTTDRSESNNNQEQVIDNSREKVLIFTRIGGNHRFITQEKIQSIDQSTHKYSGIILKHDSERYSKPIIDIENVSESSQVFQISGSTETAKNVELSVTINGTSYILQKSDGTFFSHSIRVEAGQSTTAYLSFKSDTDVLFDESVTLALIEEQ